MQKVPPSFPYFPNKPGVLVESNPRVTSCGRMPYRRVIGEFTDDVNFGDLLKRYADCAGGVIDPVKYSCLGDLLVDMLVFDSTQVTLLADAQYNQICTFHVNLSRLFWMAGISHWQEVPVYCNVVQQLIAPGFNFGTDTPVTWGIPGTLGQYNLQYNAALNPAVIVGPAYNHVPLMLANLLPVLSRVVVTKGTLIFEGIQ